jgi:alkaline phosphatase D
MRFSLLRVSLSLALAVGTNSLGEPARAEESRPETLQLIAFGSCASQTKDQPIWDDVVAVDPDLFVFVGDNIYGDTEDMKVLADKYAELGAKPGYRKLLETCPVLATWDDHDYGVNDGGEWYPKKAESQQVMLDFFGVPADSPRRSREGVYGAYMFGPEGKRVQLILLDARYFKSRMKKDDRPAEEKKRLNLVGWYVPNDDPDAAILGEAQWAWLEEQLKQPADLRIIASSIQVIADEKGMESWGNAPRERERLYKLIEKTGAEGVIFISGDVHFSEISKVEDGPYPFVDFTSSGLTNSEPSWAAAVNSHRTSAIAYAKPTFGLIEIDWSASPKISLEAVGLGGEVAFRQELPLSQLRPKRSAGDK